MARITVGKNIAIDDEKKIFYVTMERIVQGRGLRLPRHLKRKRMLRRH